ncbi:hypothetical protein D3C72_1950860 [compost metagenome]
MRVLAVPGEALEQILRCLARQQGNSVVALLAVVLDVVAKRLDVGMGKLLVGYLGFLQTDDIRLVPLDQLSQLMRTCAQSIDIEGNEFHGVVFHSDSSAAILTDRAGGRPDCAGATRSRQ